jgi:hypothetical protein
MWRVIHIPQQTQAAFGPQMTQQQLFGLVRPVCPLVASARICRQERCAGGAARHRQQASSWPLEGARKYARTRGDASTLLTTFIPSTSIPSTDRRMSPCLAVSACANDRARGVHRRVSGLILSVLEQEIVKRSTMQGDKRAEDLANVLLLGQTAWVKARNNHLVVPDQPSYPCTHMDTERNIMHELTPPVISVLSTLACRRSVARSLGALARSQPVRGWGLPIGKKDQYRRNLLRLLLIRSPPESQPHVSVVHVFSRLRFLRHLRCLSRLGCSPYSVPAKRLRVSVWT